nr:hypothetical protein HmN_000928300 [Hymenolepis microstoma]
MPRQSSSISKGFEMLFERLFRGDQGAFTQLYIDLDQLSTFSIIFSLWQINRPYQLPTKLSSLSRAPTLSLTLSLGQNLGILVARLSSSLGFLSQYEFLQASQFHSYPDDVEFVNLGRG